MTTFTSIGMNYLWTNKQEMSQQNNFEVYTLTTVDESQKFVHWSEGLTMYIIKDGVTIKINSEEIEQLVKALPETIGGTY